MPDQKKSVSHPPESVPTIIPKERACPERSRRGGKRPGAGAPRGNLNAVKHGRYSQQFAALGAALARSPAARAELERLARRVEEQDVNADMMGAFILSQVMTRGLARGAGRMANRLILLPPVDDSDSINQIAPPQVRNRPEKISRARRNQTSGANSGSQSNSESGATHTKRPNTID